ncbi:MAG: sulfurtransferase [Comamonadaceae bacterium]|nr:sulfurtransferase [Comamonadaceae bacterium]
MTSFLSPKTLKSWLHDGGEIALLDVREHGQYGESHLFYGVPLPYSRLEVDVGRLVPRQSVRVVVYDSGEADTDKVAIRAAAQLKRIGYSDVHVLEGGTRAWKEAGYVLFAGVNLPSKTFGELAEHAYGTPRVTARQLAAMLKSDNPPTVLDGRPLTEFKKMSIPSATCCPNGELAYRVKDLVPDPSTPIVINCAGRTRSIIGAQTLINLGVENPVFALENGTQGWFLEDLGLEHGSSRRYKPDAGSLALLDAANQLAERFGVPRVEATTVQAWACDASRTTFLCDVRSPEEFAAGSLSGAQSAPGGQLLQAGDQYFGVRGARLVLFDDDGVRAPTAASWLRQMGHDASVLIDGMNSGLAFPAVPQPAVPALRNIKPHELLALLPTGKVSVMDLRSSTEFRKRHITGARWSIRPRIGGLLKPERAQVVLVADDPLLAAWAATSEWPSGALAPLLLSGSIADWEEVGLPMKSTSSEPEDIECIDYLFFVHDRHDGNKEAARRYLAWETGLVAQLDGPERQAFRLPMTPAGSGNDDELPDRTRAL